VLSFGNAVTGLCTDVWLLVFLSMLSVLNLDRECHRCLLPDRQVLFAVVFMFDMTVQFRWSGRRTEFSGGSGEADERVP